jgi:integrase
MAAIMANVRQRKSARTGEISYTVQVRLTGYPPQTATFKRKTDAHIWAQQTEAAIREGRHFPYAESKRHTVSDLIDRWLKKLERDKPVSQDKQTQELRWWREQIGGYALSRVTPALIGECRDSLLAENIGTEAVPRYRVPATANRYLAALSKAFTEAVREWHWVRENPVLRVSKGKESPGVVRYLSNEERERLLAECDRLARTPNQSPGRLARTLREKARMPADTPDAPWLHCLVFLALTTGARRAELLELRWPQVDLDRGLLVFLKTKNGEIRSASVVGKALAALRAWSESPYSKSPHAGDDRVFPGLSRDKPLAIDFFWRRALKRAGVRNFRFHDLRHSAASYLAMSGATAPEIAAVLGHKQLQMVKRYAHLGEQHTASVVSRMVDKFLS